MRTRIPVQIMDTQPTVPVTRTLRVCQHRRQPESMHVRVPLTTKEGIDDGGTGYPSTCDHGVRYLTRAFVPVLSANCILFIKATRGDIQYTL